MPDSLHRSPPTQVAGGPSTLIPARVSVVRANGHVDVRHEQSRASKLDLRVPKGYTPVVGDRVVIGYLLGDDQAPVVLTVLAP